MRNDVHFPPPPGSEPDPTPEPPVTSSARSRAARSPEATHPHPADRAHSLNQTSDRAATGPLYETPEDRGGIDSTTLSIVVVSVVAVALLIVAWTVFRGTGSGTLPAADPNVPNATIVDDAPASKTE